MNYLHSYHAGSFADVVKHSLLIALIQALQRKETPFCYLDTHAGAGYYDLKEEAAQKNKEYLLGITKLLAASEVPTLILPYLDFIRHFQLRFGDDAQGEIRYYPGSPSIAHHFIRPEDRLILCELHPATFQTLKQYYGRQKQVAIHQTDGFSALKAFLPPKERRGLILIDPPYEHPDEFSRICAALQEAVPQFEAGVYAIWYPLKNKLAVSRFKTNLQKQFKNPLLAVELSIYSEETSHQLQGSGLIVMNPPWQFAESLQTFFPWLSEILKIDEKSSYSIERLK